MPYPFPGMNPWLEKPGLWRDVHHSLISALREALAPQLAPRYFVSVETHTYITRREPMPPMSRFPDLMVVDRGGTMPQKVVAESVAPYVIVELPEGDPLIEAYLLVRFVETGEVVTAIELLSHTNKRVGEQRDEYLEKRSEFMHSRIHFVEIDLLRAGKAMPSAETVPSDYRIFIRRRETPHEARVYPFNVQQPIPTFPLPLLPEDQEPIVDLGTLLQDVYARARYDLVINYAEPPEPALKTEDAAWAAQRLVEGMSQR